MSVRSFARALANPVAALAVAITLVGGAGVATAATGGTFLLGRANYASSRTGLTNSAGTPLSLTAKAGYPPLAVSNDVKVPRLNADELDGLNSTDLQRRVTGACPGGAVTAVASNGSVTCAPLPMRFLVAKAVGESVVAVVGGATLWLSCTVVEEYEGPRHFLYAYLTGPAGTLVNGHAITTPYSGTTAVEPVGFAVPASGGSGKLPTFEGSDYTFGRQTAVLMVTNGTAVTQVTLHLTLDTRGTATPCGLTGTAV